MIRAWAGGQSDAVRNTRCGRRERGDQAFRRVRVYGCSRCATSGGSAKMVEDRLGKTRSAVVTAIRICFIISRCAPELLLGGTKIYDGRLHGSPHGKGLTLPRSIERGNLSHNEASSG
jgi:hypothetical protein